jgi:hypothetical protein
VDGVTVLLDDVYTARADTQHLDVPALAAVRNARIAVTVEAASRALPDDLTVTLRYETEEPPLNARLAARRRGAATAVPPSRWHASTTASSTRGEVRWGRRLAAGAAAHRPAGLHTRHLQLSEDWIDVRR